MLCRLSGARVCDIVILGSDSWLTCLLGRQLWMLSHFFYSHFSPAPHPVPLRLLRASARFICMRAYCPRARRIRSVQRIAVVTPDDQTNERTSEWISLNYSIMRIWIWIQKKNKKEEEKKNMQRSRRSEFELEAVTDTSRLRKNMHNLRRRCLRCRYRSLARWHRHPLKGNNSEARAAALHFLFSSSFAESCPHDGRWFRIIFFSCLVFVLRLMNTAVPDLP